MPTPQQSDQPKSYDLNRVAAMFNFKDADTMFPKNADATPPTNQDSNRPYAGGGVYWVNNLFGTDAPADTSNEVSHSFLVNTWRDPSSGKEYAVNAYSWVPGDTDGMWEDPKKLQNLAGGQAAIDKGMALRLGGEKEAGQVDDVFQKNKDNKGGFLSSCKPGFFCKSAILDLWHQATSSNP